jgi:hypothetical protein
MLRRGITQRRPLSPFRNSTRTDFSTVLANLGMIWQTPSLKLTPRSTPVRRPASVARVSEATPAMLSSACRCAYAGYPLRCTDHRADHDPPSWIAKMASPPTRELRAVKVTQDQSTSPRGTLGHRLFYFARGWGKKNLARRISTPMFSLSPPVASKS